MVKKTGLLIIMTVILIVSAPVFAAEQTSPPSTAVETISLEKCLSLALQSLEESLETTRANQANIQLSQESLKQIQVRFSAGMATTNDITDAQLALEQTLNGYYQGISSYLTGLAKLDLIAGKDVD